MVARTNIAFSITEMVTLLAIFVKWLCFFSQALRQFALSRSMPIIDGTVAPGRFRWRFLLDSHRELERLTSTKRSPRISADQYGTSVIQKWVS